MYIAIDFETELISEDSVIPEPICISYWDGKKGSLYIQSDMEAFLSKILYGNYDIIAHNMKFEFLVIYKHFPSLRPILMERLKQGKLICTKIVEKIRDNTRKKKVYKFGLSDLVYQYFGKDISEDKKDPLAWRLRYHELKGVPLDQWPKKAVSYAVDDSMWSYKLWNEIQKNYKNDYILSVQSECMLGLIGATGITIDKEKVKILQKEINDILEPHYKYLREHEFYDGSKKMKKFREHIEKEIPEVKRTAKGQISTDFEALRFYLTQKDDYIVRAFKEINEYEKIKTAFISNLLKAKECIRTEYNAVVSTGRTSSYKSSLYSTVNIQQMPRKVNNVTWDVRNCFIPRKGYKLVAIDYSGLELASTAHQLYTYYGYSKLRDTINSGNTPVDLHSKLACRIMSSDKGREITYEEFIKNKKNEEYAYYRQLSKPINLGFPGGIGYDTMRTLLARSDIHSKLKVIQTSYSEHSLRYYLRQLQHEYPDLRIKRTGFREYALVYDELVKLKRELFNLYPELGRFLNKGHLKALTGEHVNMKNEWGEWEKEPMYRYNTHKFLRDYCTYTAYCNGYLMQTPSAIGAKTMVNNVMYKYHDSHEVNVLAFIHDEILIEVLDSPKIYDIIKDISNIMCKSMQEVLPSVRIAVEANLMDYWCKSGGSWEKTYWVDNET